MALGSDPLGRIARRTQLGRVSQLRWVGFEMVFGGRAEEFLTDSQWVLIAPMMPGETVKGGHPFRITAALSRGSSTGNGRGFRGGICRKDSVRGRRCGNDIDSSAVTVPGTAFSASCCPGWMRRNCSGGKYPWTQRRIVRISTTRSLAAAQGDLSKWTNFLIEPPDHAIGRSRVGLTTKIHALCDARMLLLVVLLGTGQGGDSPMFAKLMRSSRVPRQGTPRERPPPDEA